MDECEQMTEFDAFSHFLFRAGAVPISSIRQLRSSRAGALFDELHSLERMLPDLRASISDALHAEVGQQPDRNARRQLLSVRRSLHQEHLPSHETLSSARRMVSTATLECLDVVVDALRRRIGIKGEISNDFHTTLLASRLHLQRAVREEDFRTGLLLSSRALYRNLNRYTRADARRLTARDEQVERGIVRYYTRAVMKATPFARFCAVGQGRFSSGGAGPVTFSSDPQRKVGHVRLNKSIYGLLWNHLKCRPQVRNGLCLDVNPTLQSDEAVHCFIANVNGRELIQRVPRSPAIDLCISCFGTAALAFGCVVDALVAHPLLEVSEETARDYVARLIEIGLFRHRSIVSEQEADWEVVLVKALAFVDDEHARSVAAMLIEVHSLRQRYANANAEQRETLGEELRALLTREFAALGMGSPLTRDLPIFEDASTDAVMQLPRSPGLKSALYDLGEWIRLTDALSYPNVEQATMRSFFETRYGGRDDVPLLQFYEEFYRDHLKEHLRREGEFRRVGQDKGPDVYDVQNPFKLPQVNRIRAASARLRAAVEQRWASSPEAEEIRIPLDVAREAVRELASHGRSSAPRSTSVFAQLVLDSAGEPQRFVLSNGRYLVGFGKYFSRFLYTLPDRLTTAVIQRNTLLAGTATLAEICGDSKFNANLHPAMLPSMISYPTGEDDLEGAHIKARDLLVVPDPESDFALALVHRESRARVLPVDLGFLNPQMRPPFFQLIARFTPGAAFTLALPQMLKAAVAVANRSTVEGKNTESEERAVVLESSIVYRPRIVFGDRLILARRRWTVNSRDLPSARAGDDGSEFYIAINLWRRALRVPSRVFLRMYPTAERRGGMSSAAARTHNSDSLQPSGAARALVRDSQPNTTPVDRSDESSRQTKDAVISESSSVAATTAAVDSSAKAGVSPTRRPRPSRDWTKPQFICFESPLLVRLLSRLWLTAPHFRVEIEEALPDDHELVTYQGNGFATELVIQGDVVASSAQLSELVQSDLRNAADVQQMETLAHG